MAELKQFTREDVKKTDSKLTRLIIHDKVYDVTEFLNEHPGGEEILLDHKGKDASEDFDDVGHSTDAHALMKKYVIGEVVKEERTNSKPKQGWVAGQNKTKQEVQGPPVIFYVCIVAVFSYLFAAWYWQLAA